MAETKYGKHIIREPIVKTDFSPDVHLCGEENCAGGNYPNFPVEISIICVAEPRSMSVQHAHDYDQILLFLGGNPTNFFEFGAEIEIPLGQEAEKHIIDTSTIVFIPKGLLHCPLEFKRVDKPILFMHLSLSPEYTRATDDMTGHPPFRERYSLEEVLKLRKGIPKGK